jgi:hypothetical protein
LIHNLNTNLILLGIYKINVSIIWNLISHRLNSQSPVQLLSNLCVPELCRVGAARDYWRELLSGQSNDAPLASALCYDYPGAGFYVHWVSIAARAGLLEAGRCRKTPVSVARFTLLFALLSIFLSLFSLAFFASLNHFLERVLSYLLAHSQADDLQAKITDAARAGLIVMLLLEGRLFAHWLPPFGSFSLLRLCK